MLVMSVLTAGAACGDAEGTEYVDTGVVIGTADEEEV